MTLLELMTALTVLAILTAFAVPSFREYSASARATATTNDLVTALNLARSDALRRATLGIVCASADQATCSRSNEWTSGWLVFADLDGDGRADDGERIQSWPAPRGGVVARSTQDRFVYGPTGMGVLPPGESAVSFRVGKADCSGDRVGATVVSLSGTVQTRKATCPP